MHKQDSSAFPVILTHEVYILPLQFLPVLSYLTTRTYSSGGLNIIYRIFLNPNMDLDTSVNNSAKAAYGEWFENFGR